MGFLVLPGDPDAVKAVSPELTVVTVSGVRFAAVDAARIVGTQGTQGGWRCVGFMTGRTIGAL